MKRISLNSEKIQCLQHCSTGTCHNINHIGEHNVMEEEAEQILLGDSLEVEFDPDRNGEERWTCLSETTGGRILIVIMTLRGGKRRVVTAFDAESWDKQRFLQTKAGWNDGSEIPKFETEAEEARWWYDNRDKLSDEFDKAAEGGRLPRGAVARLRAKRGLRYQTCLKMIIHEALRKAEKSRTASTG
jgi:uncharacterized DUF497 family protein